MKHDNATDELVEDLRDYQKTYQGRAGLWSYGLCAGNAADKIDELRGALRDLLGYVTTIPGEIHRIASPHGPRPENNNVCLCGRSAPCIFDFSTSGLWSAPIKEVDHG